MIIIRKRNQRQSEGTGKRCPARRLGRRLSFRLGRRLSFRLGRRLPPHFSRYDPATTKASSAISNRVLRHFFLERVICKGTSSRLNQLVQLNFFVQNCHHGIQPNLTYP